MPLDPPAWFLDRRAEYGIAGGLCIMARGQSSLPTLPGDCAEMEDARRNSEQITRPKDLGLLPSPCQAGLASETGRGQWCGGGSWC